MTMATTTTPMVIAVRGASKRFGSKRVLQDLDFDLPQGTVVGLLGRNGAGKSTLIKSILGLLRFDAGTSHVMGENSWRLSESVKADLGYVPQTVTLMAWMRVRHQLDYVAAFYPRWNDQLVNRLLNDWELDLDAKIKTLSEGQLQRLAILLALAHEPKLLILDEPAASLDPIARREFLQTVLQTMTHEGRTVLFSSHITSDLERIADRVAVLRDGQIVLHDELDTIKDRIKRLHITSDVPLPPTFGLPETIHEQIDTTTARVTVDRFSPELLETLRAKYNITIDVEDLNLEDLFLELHGRE